MRSLLLVILCCTLHVSFAQCIKKKDDMTGQVSVTVPIKKLGGTGAKGFETPLYLSATMTYGNGEYLLNLIPQFILSHSIHAGELIYFKFDDESVITIPVSVGGHTGRTTGMPFTQGDKTKIYEVVIEVTLSGENLNALKSKKLVKVRCDTEDYNIHGKDQKMVSDWIKCLESSK
jgi:hypothetical protein